MKLLFFLFIFISTLAFAQSACRDGDFYHDGNCYITPIFDNKHGMTHSFGQQYCKQFGAYLPSIHGSEQEDFMVIMAIRLFGKGYNWIGLSHPGKWDDMSSVDYNNWDKGYPTNKSTCVMEYFNNENNNDGHWRDDYDCDTKAKFFCQYSRNPTTPTVAPSVATTTIKPPNPPAKNSCEVYDFSYKNRCYLFRNFTGGTPNYKDSELDCESRGQTLAILDTMDYVNAVGRYAKIYAQSYPDLVFFSIGLQFNKTETKYYWADITPLTYDNWNGNTKIGSSVFQFTSDNRWVSYDGFTFPFLCSGVM